MGVANQKMFTDRKYWARTVLFGIFGGSTYWMGDHSVPYLISIITTMAAWLLSEWILRTKRLRVSPQHDAQYTDPTDAGS